jgi:hypothetical protein
MIHHMTCCIYCGAARATTLDHVPPKAIFATPPPDNLITVPACDQCNRQWSQDDEYLRRVLTLKESTYQHPAVQGNLAAVLRAFQKPAKMKFARAFFRQVRPYDLRTPAGLCLGTRWGFDVDLSRLDRAITRVVRGLYYHERHDPLPILAGVRAWSEDGLRDLHANTVAALRRSVLRPLSSVEPRVFGTPPTFEYRHQFCRDMAHASAWLLQFYGDVRFLCITLPPAVDPIWAGDLTDAKPTGGCVPTQEGSTEGRPARRSDATG